MLSLVFFSKYREQYSIGKIIKTIFLFIFLSAVSGKQVYGRDKIPDSLYIVRADTVFAWDAIQGRYVVFGTADKKESDNTSGSNAYRQAGPASTATNVATHPHHVDTCYSASNLILNGGFEDDTIGWTIQYKRVHNLSYPTDDIPIYRMDTTFLSHLLSGDIWCYPGTIPEGDHIILFDGGRQNSDTTKKFLQQSISVEPGHLYKLTFKIVNFLKTNTFIFVPLVNPIIKIQFNGTTVMRREFLISDCNWQTVQYVWYSGSDSVLDISMYDAQVNIAGNDFAIDDIQLRKIVPCSDTTHQDTIQQCAYTDTFNCKTLTFSVDSSRFCVPIKLQSDSATFVHEGFSFCLTYDTTFVKPDGIYIRPYHSDDFTVHIDSIIKGKICITISNVHHIVYTPEHEIDLGCVEFVLDNEPFDHQNTFDYLTFQVVDGCNILQTIINAWLKEDNKYWQTEDGKYWQIEN